MQKQSWEQGEHDIHLPHFLGASLSCTALDVTLVTKIACSFPMQKFNNWGFFCLFLGYFFLRKTEARANKISADLSSFRGSPRQKLVHSQLESLHSWFLPEQNDGVVLIYSSWACVKMSVKLDLIGQTDIDSLRRDDAELIIYEDIASPARFPVFSV